MLLDTSRHSTRSMFLTPGLTSAPGGGAAWAEATLALSPSSPRRARPVIHVRMRAPHRRNREDVPCQLGRGDEGKRLFGNPPHFGEGEEHFEAPGWGMGR